MLRKTNKKPEWQLKISRERIDRLLKLAEKSSKDSQSYSRRCVQLAIKIGMRYNIRLPTEIKRSICKTCYSYLTPGQNSIVRTSSKQQACIVTCKNCNTVKRFPYRREKAKKVKY